VREILFVRYSVPFVALGGLVAVASLAGIVYINRLEAELARAIREDAAGMQAAVELQVQLRHLRVHSIVLAADQSPIRRETVARDLTQLDETLAELRRTITNPEDTKALTLIECECLAYRDALALDRLPSPPGTMRDVALWSDEHHMTDLLSRCQELANRQRDRMNEDLIQTESQTATAGRVLLALGLTGILAGLLSGFAAARGLTRRVAQLSVRVQAVQAQLDQDIGAMTVERTQQFDDLDTQLDRVVERVKEVCGRLQAQERNLLRAEQLAAVGQLAAGVAHEIRNPLTGVKLLLQAAAQPRNPTPLSPDRLHLLLQEIARIERTVQGLMDFARTPPPTLLPHDVRELVNAAVEIVRSRAETKPVQIQVQLHDAPLQVNADRDQMLSLLTNLLWNAIEAAPPGGTVGVRIRVVAGGMLKVEITDTGPGIDPTIAGRLFTPFATTKPTGTGLGLTIAQQVAKQHGGSLVAGNRSEGGACFTVTLPVRGTHAEAAHR
jgi:signal transduction histidine kinase